MATITDLTGYTWVGNNTLTPTSSDKNYSINFNSNNQNFIHLVFYRPVFDVSYFTQDTQTGSVSVYNATTGEGWVNSLYKTINILGGDDANNAELITWLQANGTLTKTETITDLTGYKWVGNNPISSYQDLGTEFDFNVDDIYIFLNNVPSYHSQCKGIAINFVPNSSFYFSVYSNTGDADIFGYSDVYNEYDNGWAGDENWEYSDARTLIFSGGSGTTDQTLINWLSENGTLEPYSTVSNIIEKNTYEFVNIPALQIFDTILSFNFNSFNRNFIGIRIKDDGIYYVTENDELKVWDNAYRWALIDYHYTFITIKNSQPIDSMKYLWLSSNWNISQTNYYTITFNSNGATSGEPPSSQTLEEGTVFNLLNYNPNNLAKTNNTFLGWNTTADATEVINEIILTSDVTLYAIFKEAKSDVFELKLYQSTAEPNRVNKTSYLTLVKTLQGALRNYTSITDLSITIEYELVPNFNYIYIPIFNRYYFVTDISSVREHLWEISASCDVLMTYKDGLLNCSAFIDRNENSYDQLIIDDKLPIKQGQTVDVHFITNNLFDINSGYYVLQGLNLSVEEDTETQSIETVDKEVQDNVN